jgi:hypothetical protein
MSFFNK